MKDGFIKTLVDAIRDWVKTYVAQHAGGTDSRVDGILEKIPSAASSTNQLADKSFVNSSVQTATANFRGSYSLWSAVPSDSSYYPEDYAGNTTPTTNDYLVVEDASEYIKAGDKSFTIKFNSYFKYVITLNGISTTLTMTNGGTISADGETIFNCTQSGAKMVLTADEDITFNGESYTSGSTVISITYNSGDSNTYEVLYGGGALTGTWRFKYTGEWDTLGKSGWKEEYQVNEEPFTSDQVAAINSGITAELVEKLKNL